MKVCLVNPRLEGPYPPLGITYLSAYLKKYGQNDYEVKVIDGNCSEDIIDEIIKFGPSVVGFTALSPQINDAVALSNILKSKEPEVLQVIGGIHVSAAPEHTLGKGSFDLAIIGEGEETFKNIVDGYFEQRKARDFYLRLEGIAFLDNNKLVYNPRRKEIENLDSIPFPERPLLKMDYYLSQYLIIRGLFGNRIATVHTSRGCPYDCVFCSCNIISKKVRYFSVEYVISEVKELIDKYKIKAIFFTDDTFILNKKRVREICQRFIEEGINKKVKWEAQGRANLIDWADLGMLKLMK
ncbi:MAG: B12-binding domain-containing radical SAM protein, partial [Candidatus Omnitrophota bacterium]